MKRKEIKVKNIVIGRDMIYMAGPCSIESQDHIISTGKKVKEMGANVLRGGAFKPRTSPDSFQGLGEEALVYLAEAGRLLDMPTISEIVDPRDVDLFKDIDILQVGARNMQNFALLKELGKLNKPILLKRGMGATLDELLAASDYIRAGGNDQVILCERGIRTFESSTRYTLDIAAVAVLKRKTDMPIIIDPSHAAGRRDYIEDLALAAVAAGADGLIIEVHPQPEEALSDQDQQILPRDLGPIIEKAEKIRKIVG